MNDKTKTKAHYEKGKLVKLERATQGSPHTRTKEEKRKDLLKKFNAANDHFKKAKDIRDKLKEKLKD